MIKLKAMSSSSEWKCVALNKKNSSNRTARHAANDATINDVFMTLKDGASSSSRERAPGTSRWF